MSFTGRFGSLIVPVGHGSTSTNDPFANGLDCDVCGGRSGEANAQLAALLPDDPAMRDGLADRRLAVREGTVFLVGLRDTTTDSAQLFDKA